MTDAVTVRAATPADASALATLAALTFPLACPPHTTEASIVAFIAANLSETSFAGYLIDPARSLFVAECGGALLGYTMLVAGEPRDPDVAAAVSVRPTIELSKCYLHPDAHGSGAAAALVAATLVHARGTGASGIWLGVNQLNTRAQRFYGRQGFQRVGTKRFLVGDAFENDYVYERAL